MELASKQCKQYWVFAGVLITSENLVSLTVKIWSLKEEGEGWWWWGGGVYKNLVVKVVTLRFTYVSESVSAVLFIWTWVQQQAQTNIRGGPRKQGERDRQRETKRDRARERESGRHAVKFLLHIVFHFSTPQKSPECETAAASATAVQKKNTNRLWTSKMPADMFRWAGLHNECRFSANCLDNALTGFIATVRGDPRSLLLGTKH